MADYLALIEQLCARRATLVARRATLVQAMAVNPEQITDEQIGDLAALQSAFAAVEAEHRRAKRETLHEEVQQPTGSYACTPRASAGDGGRCSTERASPSAGKEACSAIAVANHVVWAGVLGPVDIEDSPG